MIIIVAIVVTFLAIADAVPLSGLSHQRTIRLCSKKLSDALYLVCRDRGGYNEPFSYSSRDNMRSPGGPGIVEECCYRRCSYEQLEQYCKPINDDETNGNDVNNSQDEMEESLSIVNLPYASTKKIVSESRAITGERNVGAINVKCKDCNESGNGAKRKKGRENALWGTTIARNDARKRHLGDHLSGYYDIIDNDNKPDRDIDADVKSTPSYVYQRHRCPLCRRRDEALGKVAMVNVPKFKIGRTLPDPNDSFILIFPSRMNLASQRTAEYLFGESRIKSSFLEANNGQSSVNGRVSFANLDF